MGEAGVTSPCGPQVTPPVNRDHTQPLQLRLKTPAAVPAPGATGPYPSSRWASGLLRSPGCTVARISSDASPMLTLLPPLLLLSAAPSAPRPALLPLLLPLLPAPHPAVLLLLTLVAGLFCCTPAAAGCCGAGAAFLVCLLPAARLLSPPTAWLLLLLLVLLTAAAAAACGWS